ncbi:MAG: type IX secretion system membrane protein PorP/SprF [Bacteroidales bacterium]|nr:type IX secretion system membrane protein PorP/SprF [Bacteroidales bacterium]
MIKLLTIQLAFVLAVFCTPLTAQESNYSKILSQNQKISPTFTGDILGNWRVTTNYMNIRTSSFKYDYFTLSYDQPFFIRRYKIGIGLHAMQDNISSVFSTQKVQLSLALHPVIQNHILSFGMHAGYVTYEPKLGDELFPSQYDFASHSFRNDLPTNENINDLISFIDLGVGVKWRKQYNDIIPEVGINLLHLNSPQSSVASGSVKLKPDALVTSAVKWHTSAKWYSMSEFMYYNNQNNDKIFVGEIMTYIISDNFMEKSVFAGLFLNSHHGRFYSTTPLIGANYNQWHIAFSYDINFSQLQRKYTPVKGPFEITISYMSISNHVRKLTLPCVRY